ncbi:MAG: outer membrane beta-barrel protein [Saprospiraceae bacterium]|nr:outer membrane beta-barrel protein [Saprospiraceae bacterium]
MKLKTIFFNFGLTFSICTFCHMKAQSQIEKGTFSIGPSLDFSSSNQKITDFGIELKTTRFKLGLRSDYFIINNLSVGLALSYNSQNTDIDGDDNRTSGFFIGPQVDYFILMANEFYISIGAGLGYNSLKEDDEINGEFIFSGIGYGLRTGIHYIVNKKIGAFMTIGPDFGNLTENENELDVSWSEFETQVGLKFFF